MTRIRGARATDIAGIADVVKHVWEQDILADVCEAQVAGDSCALWVAVEDAEVVGFASAFLTVDLGGHRRWEVDLVAVRPDSQGRGLGTQLIRHVCEAGESNKAPLARALIRVENVASQRAFEHVGFTTDGQVHQLVLWGPRQEDGISAGEPDARRSPSTYAGPVGLVPIDTLTYRGLWIEGLTSVCAEEQRVALKTARAVVARERRDNTGALIPLKDASRLAIDLREEGVVQGEYTWFVRLGCQTRNVGR